MNRVVLAVLGVVLAVVIIVVIARQGSDTSTVSADAGAKDAAAPEEDAGEDLVLEVKELALGDGGLNQASVRIDHPSQVVQARLRDWLEPRETAAVASGASIDCHAQVAKTSLISITCSSLAAAEPDAGMVDGGGPTVKYESLTIKIRRGQVKDLALADVLERDAGSAEVIAACKKAADPDLPCEWPPTSFAVSPGGTLFICHESHCVDIDGEAMLLRPEFR